MAIKPEWFSPNAVLNNGISPKELDRWVNYIREDYYEVSKERISQLEDIRIEMTCWYTKYGDTDRQINGEINVWISSHSTGLVKISTIHFSKRADARDSFDRYAVFKGITDISENEELPITDRRMQMN